jgi:hypothetical protein
MSAAVITERKAIRCELHHLREVLEETGIEVESELTPEFKHRLSWIAPDGTPMEAVEFIELEGNAMPELSDHLEAARAIKPVGTGLEGFWVRVERCWGSYRYPAGKPPADTGIQYKIGHRDGNYGETVRFAGTETERAIACKLAWNQAHQTDN